MKRKYYISPVVVCRPVECLKMLATSGVLEMSEEDAEEFGEVYSNQNRFDELW